MEAHQRGKYVRYNDHRTMVNKLVRAHQQASTQAESAYALLYEAAKEIKQQRDGAEQQARQATNLLQALLTTTTVDEAAQVRREAERWVAAHTPGSAA